MKLAKSLAGSKGRFGVDSPDILINLAILRDYGIEVAIKAKSLTERHMNIETRRDIGLGFHVLII